MSRLLSLDYEPLFGDGDDLASTFDSDTSCFDFDVVLWDPARSFESYAEYSATYHGLPSLSDTQSARIMADVIRRRAEFQEFLSSGRTLIVVSRPPQSCYVATGEVRTSGTGRNASKTRIVDRFDIHAALPITDPKFVRAAGNRIEPVGDGVIQRVFRAHAKHLTYAATMTEPRGTVLARVRGTTQAVSTVVRTTGGGLFLLVPDTTFKANIDEDGEEAWPEEASKFQADLIDALGAISGTADVIRPSWSERFATQQVLELRAEVAKRHAAVDRARGRLAKAKESTDRAEALDQLYLGTGRQLELRVADVMRLLGAVVSEQEPGRADLHVEFDGRPAVLEVKGRTGSAAEKDAAQLEKWVAAALETSGTAPKGILVVNAWRELPLDERTQTDFPAQMIPYSTAREHALVTGLELFCIAQEVLTDPSKRDFWRGKLTATIGRITEVPDWRGILHETSATVDSSDR
ncbi:hypothetical protein [Agromyces badenianii]|uniref:hypothetical protein n=1 Tax=Agromyces badenianii TaxID=2080742 RepID=UPI000D593061|nr:hypothetical protein [Agromyces badenianii]PWC05127.1 hypothetical protein DCE94_02135 [Agromyces badenianii]